MMNVSNVKNSPLVIVNLNSIDKVKEFNEIISKHDEDCDLCTGRYTINAKSIMGIFSLDLTKPMTLIVHTDDTDKFLFIRESINKFIVSPA